MVADDHPAFRNGVAAFLREHFTGCSIDEAANGDEVLDALTHFDYNIFFIDIVMPGLNGIETTKKIVANHPDAKVIALSFYEDEQASLPCLKAG
jgi:NarL family two-component system response regulator LiaR